VAKHSQPKPPTDPRLLSFARGMRREPTDAEKRLWSRLRDRRLGGFKFRRQAPFAGYVLDFYCEDASLAVELDGGQHNDADGARRDQGRDGALRRLGVTVLRFWDPDALKETDAVCEAILAALTAGAAHTPSPLPSPGGRGGMSLGSPDAPKLQAPFLPLPPGEDVARKLNAPEQPAPILPLPPGEGRGEGVCGPRGTVTPQRENLQ
jgi:very-short-patch-repair endonuclease